MNKYNLGLEQIISLLDLKLRLEDIFANAIKRLMENASSEVSVTIPINNPEQTPIFGAYIETTAQKLLKLDFSVPLRTSEEVITEISQEVDKTLRAEPDLDTKLTIDIKQEVASMVETSLLGAPTKGEKISHESSYASYWKWINALHEMQAETEDELPVTLQTFHSLARRCITKEELLGQIQRQLADFFQVENWVQNMLNTTMRMATQFGPAQLSEEELTELRGEVEPEIRAHMNKIIPPLQESAIQAARVNIEMFWAVPNTIN